MVPLLAIVGPPFPLIFALLLLSRFPRHRWPAFVALATAGGMLLLDVVTAFNLLTPLWLAPTAGLVAIGLVYLVRLPWKTNWIGMALAIGGFIAAMIGAFEVLAEGDENTPLFFLPRAGTAGITAMIVMALGFNAAHERVKRIPVVDGAFGPNPQQLVVADVRMYVHVVQRIRGDLTSAPPDLALVYAAARLTRGGLPDDSLREHLIDLAADAAHAPETGPTLLNQRLQAGQAPTGAAAHLPDPYGWRTIPPDGLRRLVLDDGRFTRLWRTAEKLRRTKRGAAPAKLQRELSVALLGIDEPAELAGPLLEQPQRSTDPTSSRHELNRAVLDGGQSPGA